MKFKDWHIDADVTVIEEPGISFRDSYPSDKWCPELDIFVKTYRNLINEWAKNLFAPYELLCDIVKKLHGSRRSILMRYRLSDILSIASIDWKCYEKFKEASLSFDRERFSIFVLFVKSPWPSVKSALKSHGFDNATIAEIRSKMANTAFCLLNVNSPGDGCIIVVNGYLVDSNDEDALEQHIDHELNHYFEQFSKDRHKQEDLRSLSDKIMKIGSDAGYDLSSEFAKTDFIDHMLKNSEFKPMIANVCNILEKMLRVEDRYAWLVEHSTSSFVKTHTYRQLHGDLQNVLLFTTICRAYSLSRWHELLEDLRVQFDRKETFTEKLKCGFLTMIEKLKRLV